MTVDGYVRTGLKASVEPAFEALLHRLSHDEATGAIVVPATPAGQARVWLRIGAVVAADVPGRRPDLGLRMVSAGVLSPQALESALDERAARRPSPALVDLLSTEGYVDRAVVLEYLTEEIVDQVAELVRQTAADAWFDEGGEPGEILDSTIAREIHLDARQLITAARERRDSWELLLAELGGASSVPVLSTSSVPGADVVLGPGDWSLLCKVDGGRTVTDLAYDCGFTIFEAAEVVRGLLDAGLVELDDDVDGDYWNDGDTDFSDSALADVLCLRPEDGDAAPMTEPAWPDRDVVDDAAWALAALGGLFGESAAPAVGSVNAIGTDASDRERATNGDPAAHADAFDFTARDAACDTAASDIAASDGTASGDAESAELASDENAADEVPVAEIPVDENAADETAAQPLSVDESVAQQALADESVAPAFPADGSAALQSSVEEAAAQQIPVEESAPQQVSTDENEDDQHVAEHLDQTPFVEAAGNDETGRADTGPIETLDETASVETELDATAPVGTACVETEVDATAPGETALDNTALDEAELDATAPGETGLDNTALDEADLGATALVATQLDQTPSTADVPAPADQLFCDPADVRHGAHERGPTAAAADAPADGTAVDGTAVDGTVETAAEQLTDMAASEEFQVGIQPAADRAVNDSAANVPSGSAAPAVAPAAVPTGPGRPVLIDAAHGAPPQPSSPGDGFQHAVVPSPVSAAQVAALLHELSLDAPAAPEQPAPEVSPTAAVAEPQERAGLSGMQDGSGARDDQTDTAALLRELSSLGGFGAEEPRAAAPGRPTTVRSATPQRETRKQRRGFFR